LVSLLTVTNLIAGVLRSVADWRWNDVRLARGIALGYGYPLYPGRDSMKPIIGTMHGPVAHLLYACLTVLKNPTLLLIAGCTLSCLLYFGTVLWLHLRTGRRLAGAYGFFACTALMLASPGGRYSGLTVHVDALAICFAVVAGGMLAMGEPGNRALTASAILAMLSVATKQTMAPAAIALPCFVLMVYGKRTCARYVATQVAASAAICLAMLAMFRPPRDLLFNTFTLGIRQPSTGAIATRLMEGLFLLRGEIAAAAAPLLLLIAVVALSQGNVREKIANHRWLVFLWMAMLELPMELRAWITTGVVVNHLSLITLFVGLGTTLGLVQLSKPDEDAKGAWTGFAARALLIGMLLANVALPYEIFRDLRLVRTSTTQVAYNYERRHPGRAYFPLNPLATLLAEGRLTHFDPALYNRELAGFPVSQEQLAAGIPAGCELVAYPPRQIPRAAILATFLNDKPLVQEPGLRGWRVYRITQPASESRP
jgi:hypothetical protein